MRSVIVSVGAFILAANGSALAADMPVKAPVYKAPVVAPYSWTGWYVGASAGYGWSDSSMTLASVGSGAPLEPDAFAEASANATPPILNTHAHGFIGGGQFGYNYQINRMVWGLEADFSFADIKGSDTKSGTAPVVGFPATPPAEITALGEQKLNFFGTVRGRFGFTPIDSLLVYATGGLAYGHVESRTNTSDRPIIISTGPASGSASAMRAGGRLAVAWKPRWPLRPDGRSSWNISTMTLEK